MGRMSRSLTALQQALTLLRTLLLIGVLGGVLVAGYWLYQLWNEQSVYERYLHNLLGEQRVAEELREGEQAERDRGVVNQRHHRRCRVPQRAESEPDVDKNAEQAHDHRDDGAGGQRFRHR